MAFNSYNQQRVQPNQTQLGVPTAGFASRGKNAHIRNISVPVPVVSDQPSVSTPRTARGQLLAGLRTQPKTPTTATPMSSSFGAEITNTGLDASRYASASKTPMYGPKTARGLGMGGSPPSGLQNQYSPAPPTPPVASPAIAMNGEMLYDQQDFADAQAYADMLAQTNLILAHRQQQLQQQLLLAQQNAQLQQQLAGLQLQSPMSANFSTPPMSPGMSMYQQNTQSLNGVANGVYQVYNPMTGQYQYYLQPQQQQQKAQTGLSQMTTMSGYELQQQAQEQLAQQQQQQQQQEQRQEQQRMQNRNTSRSRSPPKLNINQNKEQQSSTPREFRKGHRKASSLASCVNANHVDVEDAPRTGVPRLSMLPATPQTATFAPGHASGTHPIRQPRGPPNFEEIKSKPTTKHEGSKNFASRQRRKAVSRLISAGIERRGVRVPSGTMTPVSENDGGFTFEDADSVTSSLSGRQSLQSLREGPDSPPGYSASSMSGDEGSIGGKFVEVKKEGMRTQVLIQQEAGGDKRRSALF